MFFRKNHTKSLNYYYGLNLNYNIYIIISKLCNNWIKIDKIENDHVYFQEKRIHLKEITAFVVACKNGELLDCSDKIDFLPDDVYEIFDTGLVDDKTINFADIDISENILEIKHISNPEHPKKKYYITKIKNRTDKSIKVIKFGGYYKDDNKLILNNVIDSLYSNEHFNVWYSVKNNGWIDSGEEVYDPNNFGPSGFWIYFCENEFGDKFIIGSKIYIT